MKPCWSRFLRPLWAPWTAPPPMGSCPSFSKATTPCQHWRNTLSICPRTVRANLVDTFAVVIQGRASAVVVRQFAGVLTNMVDQVKLRRVWFKCGQLLSLALAICDRVPAAFGKFVHTIASDWDKDYRRIANGIAAVSRDYVQALNLLILRTVASSQGGHPVYALCVRGVHRNSPYFVQLASNCHGSPKLIPHLVDIAVKFNCADRLRIAMIGAIKIVQTAQAQAFLLAAFDQVAASAPAFGHHGRVMAWLRRLVSVGGLSATCVLSMSCVLMQHPCHDGSGTRRGV